MRNLLALVGVSLAMIVGLASIPTRDVAPATAQTPQTVLVRFVHAFPVETPVDVYINGDLVITDLARGTATPHLRFDAETVQIDVRGTGNARSVAPIVSREIALATTAGGFGQMSLVIQPDGFGQPTLRVIEDLLSPTRADGARLHLIHAVPDVPSVDVLLESGTPFLSDASFSDPIGTLDPPDGSFTFVIADDSGFIASTVPVDMATGFLYTLLFYENPDATRTVSVLRTPVLPDPNVPTTYVQYVHASGSAGPVDVYVNDALAVPNLVPGEIVPHAPFVSGSATISLRNAGLPASAAPAFETTLDIAGSAITLVAKGELGEGTFALEALEDNITTLTPQSIRIRVINGTTNGPLTFSLGDDDPMVNTLPIGESSPVLSLNPGRYDFNAIVDDEALGGPVFIELGDQALSGGSWITVIGATVDDETDPVLLVSISPFQNRALSQPDFVQAPPPTATPTPTPTSTNTPLPPTLTPTPVTGTPPPAPTQPLMIADVNVNEGVNLQCREYPSTVARSIGLVPSFARLVVIGYGGPLDPENPNDVPVDPANFTNIEAATDFEQIWIQTEFYDTALNNTLTRCWVRSDFVLFYFFDGQQLNFVENPAVFFSYAALDPPIIRSVPANSAGAVIGQGVANPPQVVLPPPSATPTATPSLTPIPSATPSSTPDVRVQARAIVEAPLYERASIDSTILRAIPAVSIVTVTARNLDGTLLNVTYEVLGEGTFVGWVDASLLDFVSPNADIASLPVGQ